MSELLVIAEGNGLSRSEPRYRFKHHHRERTAVHYVADDKLGHDSQVHLLVGDRLHYTEGNDEENRHNVRDEECPNGKPGMTELVGDNSDDTASNPKSYEPRVGNLAIFAHEEGVNIGFVVEATAQLANNIVAVPEEGMDYHGRIGRKDGAVGECVGDG